MSCGRWAMRRTWARTGWLALGMGGGWGGEQSGQTKWAALRHRSALCTQLPSQPWTLQKGAIHACPRTLTRSPGCSSVTSSTVGAKNVSGYWTAICWALMNSAGQALMAPAPPLPGPATHSSATTMRATATIAAIASAAGTGAGKGAGTAAGSLATSGWGGAIVFALARWGWEEKEIRSFASSHGPTPLRLGECLRYILGE